MKKSILAALVSVGLLAETAVPLALAVTSKTRTPKQVSGNRSGRRRMRNTAIGAAAGAAGGALIGRGRGAGVGALVGGGAGALHRTRRR